MDNRCEYTIGKRVLILKTGDITDERVDAIVNAANSGLTGGGGVDGAIHRAGGPKIIEECRKLIEQLGCLQPGHALKTSPGRLPLKMIIHTVGPIYRGGDEGEAEVLANAYRNSLELAIEYDLKSVSFPSISTGVYGYPVDQAAKIALDTIGDVLKRTDCSLDEVTMVLFSLSDYRTYTGQLHRLAS